MRKSSRWALGVVVLSLAFGCASVVAAQQVGGYKPADTNDQQVVAAAEFAVNTRKEQEGGPLSLVSIKSAEQQVVAGMNYRLCLEVKAADETDAGVESQSVLTVVFQSLQRKYELKSWEEATCGGADDSGGHHATPSRPSLAQTGDELRTPAEGSAERQAILDAVATEYSQGDDHPAQFKVSYLKLHKGWAWINVTPLDADGNPVGEEAPLLFQLDNGKWLSRDLNDVGLEGDAHEGPHDPSPKYVKALQKKYPGMPQDIIPKKHK